MGAACIVAGRAGTGADADTDAGVVAPSSPQLRSRVSVVNGKSVAVYAISALPVELLRCNTVHSTKTLEPVGNKAPQSAATPADRQPPSPWMHAVARQHFLLLHVAPLDADDSRRRGRGGQHAASSCLSNVYMELLDLTAEQHRAKAVQQRCFC